MDKSSRKRRSNWGFLGWLLIVAAPLFVQLGLAPVDYITATSGFVPNWALWLIYAVTTAAGLTVWFRRLEDQWTAEGVFELGVEYPSRPISEFIVDTTQDDAISALRDALASLARSVSIQADEQRIVAKTRPHRFGLGERIEASLEAFGFNRTLIRISSRPRVYTDADAWRWSYRHIVQIHRRMAEILGADRVSGIQIESSEQ